MSRVEGEHLAAGSADALARPDGFAAAHHALIADRTLQFRMKGIDPPPKPPNWLEPLMKSLEAAGPVLSWIFWIIIGIAALGIVWLIVREVVRIRLPRRQPKLNISDPLWRPQAAQALALLADADALAAEGDFAAAAHLLLTRSIQDIDGRLPNTVRPALTARDIGGLARLPEAARPTFARIARVVEASLFGGASVDRAAWLDCRDAYEAFAFPAHWSAT